MTDTGQFLDRLIDRNKRLEFRPFERNDWQQFAGCDGPTPEIATDAEEAHSITVARLTEFLGPFVGEF